MLHFLAPFPIIFGVIGIIAGLVWLIATGSDEDGGPSVGLFYIFGSWYIGMRVVKALFRDPMSVLPAFGLVGGGASLIWLGVFML